jgi:predicted secreted protein
MASAAHSALVVKVSTTSGGTYYEIDGLDQASMDRIVDLLETTNLKDTSGEKTRIAGLGDASLSLSGHFESADTNGQTVCRAAAFSKSSLFVQFLRDGTNGKRAEYLVSNYQESGAVADTVKASWSLSKTGAFTDVGSG